MCYIRYRCYIPTLDLFEVKECAPRRRHLDCSDTVTSLCRASLHRYAVRVNTISAGPLKSRAASAISKGKDKSFIEVTTIRTQITIAMLTMMAVMINDHSSDAHTSLTELAAAHHPLPLSMTPLCLP